MQLVLLRLLIVSMSQGCACVGGGIERSKGSLRRCTRERTSGAGVEWLHQQKQHGVEEDSAWQPLEEGWGWAVGAAGELLGGCSDSETSANENCVAASANVAGIALLALSGDCGMGTEPEGAVSFRLVCELTRAGKTTKNTHQFVTVGDNVVLRAKEYPCSTRDSTM